MQSDGNIQLHILGLVSQLWCQMLPSNKITNSFSIGVISSQFYFHLQSDVTI